MVNTNYLIINRKAQEFKEIKMADKTAIFLDASGNAINHGTIELNETVYAALYCDDVFNVTLVLDNGAKQDVVTILWSTETGYTDGKKMLEKCLDTRLSRQNIKLNRYAEDIADKLSNGVKLLVVDAPIESDMVKCPECGMMSPKGTPYCMDCGAEL